MPILPIVCIQIISSDRIGNQQSIDGHALLWYVISVSWFLASGWESGVGGSASYDQLEAEPPTQHDKAELDHEGQTLETYANHILALPILRHYSLQSVIVILAILLCTPNLMDYRRYYQPGGTYFFTVVTEQRQPLLIEHIDRLRFAFRHAMKRYPFTIDGIVILPDHLHTLWRLPEGDDNFSIRWMVIKRKFSTGLDAAMVNPSKQAKREKGIWQRRFWEHSIRDVDDWQRHMDYIHYNPVKHGYCSTPAEWRYSSFDRSVKQGLYTVDWGADKPPAVDCMDLE